MANSVTDFVNKEPPSTSQVDDNNLLGIAMNLFSRGVTVHYQETIHFC